MNTAERIERMLRAAFAIDALTVEDESALHAGHEGAKSGGGHYRIRIVAPEFSGQARIARHRLVYHALQSLMPREIHALAIDARTPDEVGPAS